MRLIARIVVIVACLLGSAPASATSILPLDATVLPNPMPFDAKNATVVVTTTPGAECAAGVTYSDGVRPATWAHLLVRTAGTTGTVVWRWSHHSHATGIVSILCIDGALTRSVQIRFVPVDPSIMIQHQELPTPTSQPTATATASSTPHSQCRFQKADSPLHIAFCDTFDAPAGTGNRSGDLNGLFWGTSRISQAVNQSQNPKVLDAWLPTARTACNSPTQPEYDVAVCNGQLVEAVNDTYDHGNFTELAMYPTQPFDVAGRTGTVTFDVSADSEGGHAAWPAFMFTDQPVPAPYGLNIDPGEATVARNSFGFALNRASPCMAKSTGIGDIFATSNYLYRSLPFTLVHQCVTHAPGLLNHFEVRISQQHIEIWGSDAGSSTLSEMAYMDNVNLTLTRGLIWIEDVHYNGNKFDDQGVHTFTWDNVGFDGPTLPRDLHLDVNDSLQARGDGSFDLGWWAPDATSSKPLALSISGAISSALAKATGAIVTLNWFPSPFPAPATPMSLMYRLNGNGWHTLAWPYPETGGFTWRTIALPVALTELDPGNNIVYLKATDGGVTIANVDLILIAAQGVVNS